ncbi:MAG: sensor histidine kinase [Phenylobacterium sp.]|uniref:sensor histidine kinase n=1 Tax=Phenylobacterium sp. TaxID=1871053 RepID=UPI0011FA57AA|nr:sensor histidine kinase [Phenylobacterium sp.]TAJ73235.1 MAG: sensor histidine kinase [Phenylobacterium sp.]
MKRPPPSLAFRLLLAQILPLALLAAALAAGGAAVAHRVVERTSDRLLAGSVSAIAEQVGAEGGRATVALSPWALGLLDGPERDAVFYSVRQGARLVTGYPELTAGVPPPADETTFGDGRVRGMPVRVAATRVLVPGVAEPVVVTVAQTLDSRQANVRELLLGLIALPVVLVLGAALLIWPATVWALRPLRRLVARLTDQSSRPRASYAPADMSGLPIELQPLVRAYDSLLASLDSTATALQRFAADASHQLRTPLSVITANLALLGGSRLPRGDALALIRDSRDASARLHLVLRQLLALARAEAAVASGSAELGGVVRQVLFDAQRAHPSAILRARLPEAPVEAKGDPVLLQELLRNLVSNAVAYGGGTVFVALKAGGDAGHQVTVWDHGPGLSDRDLERLSERFYRGDRATGTAGAGLGIAIVRTIAEAFSIGLEIGNRQRAAGLVVRLRLRPA